MAVSRQTAVRHYYLLPCCLLLLNLVNCVNAYKAGLIANPYVRTAVVILLVLFGSSLMAFVATPALASLLHWLHRSSRRRAGFVGEIVFVAALGLVMFWLYYRLTVHGAAAIVPGVWRN